MTTQNLQTDFLIIGQGLAGSLLAWNLIQLGKSVIVVDIYSSSSSTNIAAGIINPITGRRIVKSWMADECIPVAGKTYSEIENETHTKFFHSLPVLEIFDSIKNKNDWQNRFESAEISNYINRFLPAGEIISNILAPFGAAELKQTSWLNTSLFLSILRNYFRQQNCLIEEKINYNDIIVSENYISWKNITANKIIFCEGYKASENPFFKNLPFQLSKGEILTIKSDLPETHIINHGIFILPLGNKLFKVGSTYEWNELNENPSENAKEELITKLKKIISAPFEITEHFASIRPTVKNRRPFLGMHPQLINIGIFNGLGTKGVMLAPYFAKQFAEFFIGRGNLRSEIDISDSLTKTLN